MAFFLFVHFPGFLSDLGAEEFEIGVIVGTAALISILSRPLVGTEMDRRGRRPVILAGNAVNVLALGLYLFVSDLGPFVYVVRGLHGIGEASLFTALSTYAADIVPERRRTQGLALFGVSGMLPLALSGVLGDIVLKRGDYQDLFTLALAFGVGALLLSLPLRDLPVPGGRRRSATMLTTLRTASLLPLWWITLVFSMALTGYFTFLKTYVEETGFGTVGAFFAAYAVTAIVLRLTAGWLPDRLGDKTVLFPALGILTGGFLALAATSSDLGVTIAGVLCGAGHAYVFPILYSLLVSRARISERGAAMAIFTGLFDVGTLLGGPLLGLTIGLGGYRTMFTVAGLVIVGGSLVFARWDRTTIRA
jgi:MFS family permease